MSVHGSLFSRSCYIHSTWPGQYLWRVFFVFRTDSMDALGCLVWLNASTSNPIYIWLCSLICLHLQIRSFPRVQTVFRKCLITMKSPASSDLQLSPACGDIEFACNSLPKSERKNQQRNQHDLTTEVKIIQLNTSSMGSSSSLHPSRSLYRMAFRSQ